MKDYKQKINPQAGISQLTGAGSPENSVAGYVGQWYLDVNTHDAYRKDIGDNTSTGWALKAGGAAVSSTTLYDGTVSGGLFTLPQTLSAIKTNYKIVVAAFTTSINSSTVTIPTLDMAINSYYEIGKYQARYVNFLTPSSVSSAIFGYNAGGVTVSYLRVIAL